jgi:putative pyrimidine permease RutG
MGDQARINPYSQPLPDEVSLPETILPFWSNVVLGAQHVVTMFGATVLGPLLMGFDPNVSILFSGVSTLIFYAILRGRVPSYLGSSFAFISVVTAATAYGGSGPNPNIPIALGGIVCAGLLYALIGIIVQVAGVDWVNKLFPPVVTGTIVAVIGLNLARVAISQLGTEPVGIGIGLLTTLAVALIAAFASRRFISKLSILIAAVGGTLLYMLAAAGGYVAPIEPSALRASAWIGWPAFQAPVFDLTAITLIAPVAFILVAENLDGSMGRAFFADGLATTLSGFGGGTGMTTYAENMSAMRITRNFSSMTMVFAALFAIILGFSPFFGALLRAIPTPVLGGLSLALFGVISATAGCIWQSAIRADQLDFDDSRTMFVVGTGLVMGAGDFTIQIGKLAFGGVVTATVAAVALYHLLSRAKPLERSGEEQGNSPYAS